MFMQKMITLWRRASPPGRTGTASRGSVPLLILACAIPGSLAAQGSHPCATVIDPARRLACYDEAFPPPPAAREAAARKARDEFGLDKEKSLRSPNQSPDEADPERIESRVSNVDYGNGGRRTITLENGQVWTLAQATSAGHMNVGDAIVVRKGLMGNYLMVTPAGVGLRVRRVR